MRIPELNCKNILITGGYGFLGSNYIRHLDQKIKVTNVDKLGIGSNVENLKGINLDYNFLKLDLSKSELDLKNYDCVVNFASETHVDRSIADPRSFLENNVWLVFNVLESARKTNDNIRILHISTDEVYGEALEGSFDEGSPYRPSNPYSATKVAQEALLLSYVRTYGLNASIVRPSNNYGPYQMPEKLIPKTTIRALLNLEIPVYGSGKQVRSWIHVMDTAKAIDIVLERGKKGEIYNIPGESERENIYVVREILKILKKDESLIKYVEDRPGHDFRYSIKGDKLKELGFKHTIKFEEGLKETVEWYVKNESWWKPLIEKDAKILSEMPWKG